MAALALSDAGFRKLSFEKSQCAAREPARIAPHKGAQIVRDEYALQAHQAAW